MHMSTRRPGLFKDFFLLPNPLEGILHLPRHPGDALRICRPLISGFAHRVSRSTCCTRPGSLPKGFDVDGGAPGKGNRVCCCV